MTVHPMSERCRYCDAPVVNPVMYGDTMCRECAKELDSFELSTPEGMTDSDAYRDQLAIERVERSRDGRYDHLAGER